MNKFAYVFAIIISLELAYLVHRTAVFSKETANFSNVVEEMSSMIRHITGIQIDHGHRIIELEPKLPGLTKLGKCERERSELRLAILLLERANIRIE